jgi:hypothetical protein
LPVSSYSPSSISSETKDSKRPEAVCRRPRWAGGAGSDTNGSLAVAVIGGLVSSTLLTLVVIPSVYSLVEHRISRFHKNVIQ